MGAGAGSSKLGRHVVCCVSATAIAIVAMAAVPIRAGRVVIRSIMVVTPFQKPRRPSARLEV